MFVYIDESGDLGWTLDAPYGRGGSSRFLTVALLIIPKSLSDKTKRLIKRLYNKRKQSPADELKGNALTSAEQVWFSNKAVELAESHNSIKYVSITVKKQNVQQHLRDDPNKLYNYMINLSLLDKIKEYPVVHFIPDKRSIKVKSGNSLVDYLQIKLWYELNSQTKIINMPQESHQNFNLQFVDFLAHCIWRRFEFNSSSAYNVLRRNTCMHTLFF